MAGIHAIFPNYNFKQDKLRVLFVCLGNICRSPTAEILFNLLYDGDKAVAYSRGVDYWHYGEPICPLMKEILENEGINVPKHRSRILNPSEVYYYSLIIPVDTKVEAYLKHLLSKKYHKKILPFKLLTEGKEVPDPYKKDLLAAKQTYAIIRQGVEKLIDLIK